MRWFNVLKFSPKSRSLLEEAELRGEKMYNGFLTNDESEIQKMWNESNPDYPYKLRSKRKLQKFYPIDEWYGVIVREEGKAKLVAISGFAIRSGKEGKEYAIMGGTRRAKGSQYRSFGRLVKQKPMQLTKQYPKIVGYTQLGWGILGGQYNESPSMEHDVIPDEVLQWFSKRFGDTWGVGKSKILNYWDKDWM